MKRTLWISAAILAGAVTLAAQGQSPAPSTAPPAATAQPPSPSQPPSFRAGVQLVRLDVRVTDANGHPIRDLKQGEFSVVQDGTPRPVVLFQHVALPTAPIEEVARRTVAAEVSTNQDSPRGHLFVIVFDQMHTAPGNTQRARLAAERFLKTRVHPGDRVAAYGIPGPGPQIGFTSDPKVVAAALVQVRGMADVQAAAGSMSLPEAYAILRGDQMALQRVANREQGQLAPTDTTPAGLGGAGALSGDTTSTNQFILEDAKREANQADEQSRRALAMLADILRPMSAIEGRKTILFISEGFYADRLQSDIDALAAAAAQSYSVVDTIDVNRRDLDMKAELPTGGAPYTAIHDQITSLAALSLETSGQLATDATDRMNEVFDTIGAEAEDYYLVGFTPREDERNTGDGYHRVTVKVSRPGARVSTRTGFSLGNPAAMLPRHQAIDRALAAPFAQQALPVRYTTYVMRGDGTGAERVILSLAADLPIATPADRHPADVVFVVRSAADGRVAASGSDTIPLPTAPAPGRTTGVGAYRVQFDLPSGDYLMRAVVRAPDGLVGSADRRFTVRALEGPSLTSSDLIVGGGRGELPVRATVYTGDGLGGVLDLYGRTPDQLENARVAIDVVPVGETTPVVSGFADLQDIRTTAGAAAREARIELPLTGVAPGRYVVRASTKSGGETAAEVVREIDVVGGRAPAVVRTAVDARRDPRDLVDGALAQEYIQRLTAAGAAPLADARRGLDRLGARDYAAAVAAFNTVLAAMPATEAANKWPAAATAFFLGWADDFAGQDPDAISAWRRAAYIDPTIVPVHLALADLYVRLSQPALAVQVLRAALSTLPNSPEIQDRLAQLERP